MTGVQTCALPICFPVTIGTPLERGPDEREKRLRDDENDFLNIAFESKSSVQ